MTQDSAHPDLRSPVERLADEHLAAMATLDPCHAARASVSGSEDDMLVERAGITRAFATSEVDRYLGWPAQAICYKLGEREWLAARADAQQRLRAAFDLKQWHTAALDLGSLGLAQLRAQLDTV